MSFSMHNSTHRCDNCGHAAAITRAQQLAAQQAATRGSSIQQYSEADSDALYDRLLEGNRYWVDTCTSEDPNYFHKFKQGQRPAFLLIGCSDSRVAPDQLTATKPGEIFIHRNVANVIVNTDMNFMAVLQYAVEVLRVKHVIVMGHYGCGGVVAAMSNKTHGLIDKWLRNIKDVIRLHRHELQAIPDADLRCRRLVELNVQEQVYNIYKTSILQQAWAEGDKVQVHGWVYDLATGLIRDLQVQQTQDWLDIKHIYEFDFTLDEEKDVTAVVPQDDKDSDTSGVMSRRVSVITGEEPVPNIASPFLVPAAASPALPAAVLPRLRSESLDGMLHAIHGLCESPLQAFDSKRCNFSVFAPVPHHELDSAAGTHPESLNLSSTDSPASSK